MIERIIDWSARNRFIVILMYLFVTGAGIYSVMHLPVDAIPDLSENQVIVFTEWMGRSPEVVEQQVTYPISSALQGLPEVKAVRATSMFGMSFVFVIFNDNTDLYFARNRVVEKLALVRAQLPANATPILGPDGSGVGHIFWYTVEGKSYDLATLRSIQDWYLRNKLVSVEGVAEIASIGGFVKQYQVDIDPVKMRAFKVQAANEYLQAVKPGSQAGTNASVIRTKLTLMGLTEGQIRVMETAGPVPLVVTYLSPVSGTVIEKRIVAGSYVSEGAPLYEIADLSTLWNIAEVFESDAGSISVGDRVTLTTAAYPDKKFSGTVALLYPVVNADTRTIKVRVVVANPGGKLKPNMYTETVFRSAKNRMLTLPVSAVLVTGKRNLVYVRETQADRFQAREVVLGDKFAGKYGIVSGLSEGEEVVREGGYLVDSESQLKTGLGSAHQHDSSDGPKPGMEGMPQHNH